MFAQEAEINMVLRPPACTSLHWPAQSAAAAEPSEHGHQPSCVRPPAHPVTPTRKLAQFVNGLHAEIAVISDEILHLQHQHAVVSNHGSVKQTPK